MFLPNRPRDQDCTIQFIFVGARVDIDAVVCRLLASEMENYRVNCQKSAPSEVLAVFGEVERAISGPYATGQLFGREKSLILTLMVMMTLFCFVIANAFMGRPHSQRAIRVMDLFC